MKEATLIIIGGFAGAGKTTVAGKLSRKYNYPVFSTDDINDVIRPVLHMGFHEASPMAYEIMWRLVRRQLSSGVTVILDTHMCSERVWENLDRLHGDMPSVKIIPIILQCTLDIHRQRIEERGRTNTTHLNLGGDSLDDVLFKYEFIEGLQRSDLIKIDANGSPDEVYSAVEKLLQQQQVV
jgi:predicted kinase